MARIGSKQLEKIVAAVAEEVGHPLKVELAGTEFRVVNNHGDQIVPTGTPTRTADALETWLRGYLYARLYSGLKTKHGNALAGADATRPNVVSHLLASM